MIWRRPHEYMLAELIEHPVLGAMMASAGMDRRSLELLLEAIPQIHDPGGGPAATGGRINPDKP